MFVVCKYFLLLFLWNMCFSLTLVWLVFLVWIDIKNYPNLRNLWAVKPRRHFSKNIYDWNSKEYVLFSLKVLFGLWSHISRTITSVNGRVLDKRRNHLKLFETTWNQSLLWLNHLKPLTFYKFISHSQIEYRCYVHYNCVSKEKNLILWTNFSPLEP